MDPVSVKVTRECADAPDRAQPQPNAEGLFVRRQRWVSAASPDAWRALATNERIPEILQAAPQTLPVFVDNIPHIRSPITATDVTRPSRVTSVRWRTNQRRTAGRVDSGSGEQLVQVGGTDRFDQIPFDPCLAREFAAGMLVVSGQGYQSQVLQLRMLR